MPLNITVLGLDALGASLGLALGTLDPKILDVGRPRVTGWDTSKKVLDAARGRLAIDNGSTDLAAAVSDADVVIVNVAEDQLATTFAAIAPHLKVGVIVTDLAPVKAPVMAWAKANLPATAQFIGGHPFTGIGGGPAQAKLDLFKDVMYCLVAEPTVGHNAINGMTALVTAIGAKPYYMDAAEHNSYVAGAAHLPLALSLALLNTLGASSAWTEIQPIAGEALQSATALGDTDPASAAAALHANRAAVRSWLRQLQEGLSDLDRQLDDPAALATLAEAAHTARQRWLDSPPDQRPGEDALTPSLVESDRGGLAGMFFGRRPFRKPR